MFISELFDVTLNLTNLILSFYVLNTLWNIGNHM